MKAFDTLSEAVDDLTNRGFNNSFHVCEEGIECLSLEIILHPENFEIIEIYRFEGDSDPGDASVVYGIQSISGIKGVLVNGYGMYSDIVSDAMLFKLKHNLTA